MAALVLLRQMLGACGVLRLPPEPQLHVLTEEEGNPTSRLFKGREEAARGGAAGAGGAVSRGGARGGAGESVTELTPLLASGQRAPAAPSEAPARSKASKEDDRASATSFYTAQA